MKIAVVGSRTYTNWEKVYDELDEWKEKTDRITIVSGGAQGADTWGARWAQENDVPLIVFRPKWRVNGVYNRAAGFERNTLIIQEADVVLAFWDGKSRGTKDSIDKARKMGKDVHVFD